MDKIKSLWNRLYRLEKLLQQPEIRHSSQKLAQLLADDFMEFGSSGWICNKQQIIEELSSESTVRIAMSDFRVTPLAADIVLATYEAAIRGQSKKSARRSLRSSIWKKKKGRWQMIFHQGTPVRKRQ
jgi:hypothetical protein